MPQTFAGIVRPSAFLSTWSRGSVRKPHKGRAEAAQGLLLLCNGAPGVKNIVQQCNVSYWHCTTIPRRLSTLSGNAWNRPKKCFGALTLCKLITRACWI